MVRFFTLTYEKPMFLARRDPPDGLLWTGGGALASAWCSFAYLASQWDLWVGKVEILTAGPAPTAQLTRRLAIEVPNSL